MYLDDRVGEGGGHEVAAVVRKDFGELILGNVVVTMWQRASSNT